jgi:DNA polymerase (family 10)
MDRLDAPAIAKLLIEIGQRISLAGENPYKARAYTRAADRLVTLTVPLDELIARDRLQEIPGIGAAIAATIRELHERGTTTRLEQLRSEVPEGVLGMLHIPGVKPDKILQIYRLLGTASIEELETACRQDQLRGYKGLGAALQDRILSGIELHRKSQGQRLIHQAEEILDRMSANLARSHPELSGIVAAGDFRRGCELVSDLALVAEIPEAAEIRALALNEQVKLWLADRSRYGVALLLATGSELHIDRLKRRARELGLELEERGLRREGELVSCETEARVYAALQLPYIEPELREDGREIEWAISGQLPTLVSDEDIRGLLHCHTDFSDGGNTLEEMAEVTRELGYEYFGVADHSQTAGYAGGLKPERIELQHELADALNRRYRGRFRILKGIESDILEDGSLDYPNEILSTLDFVVASVHSRFKLGAAAQTERILRAIANPFTTILGHMTGRLLLRREGYEIDIDTILQACARHQVAVEINANPHRLDLDWRWYERGLELGCMFSINPDAHSLEELGLTRWGVLIARKGGVPPDRVLNCMGRADLERWLTRRRDQHGKRASRARR